jgi:hypothetical protein
MATGIILPSLLTLSASASEALIFSSDPQSELIQSIGLPGTWTPPQYSRPALTIIQVPGGTSGTSGQPNSPLTNYIFDAIFSIKHHRSIHKTSHPVLTGANLTDHAYVLPSRITLEIGMSDVQASYQEGMWTGAATKSISAWQILKILANNRLPVTLITRLDTYLNMVITDIDSPDDNKTLHGLKATIVLEELLIASTISSSTISARPQTTDETPGGTVKGLSPNDSQVQQFKIPSPLYPDIQPLSPPVPGSGSISSDSLGGQDIVFTGSSTPSEHLP